MPVLPSDVRKAAHVVDAGSAGAILKEALGLAPQGRKSALTPRLFLIGALLTVQSQRNLVVADIYRTLTKDLDRQSQVELGVRATAGGNPLFSEKAMERLNHRIGERLEYGRGSAPGLSPEDRAARKAAMAAVVEALLAPTLPPRTYGAFAVDSSAIWAWGRAVKGPPKDLLAKDALNREGAGAEASSAAIKGAVRAALAAAPAPYEKDASWGVKTAKDGNRDTVFGFDLHALVRAPDFKADNSLEPNLIEAVDVTPAGEDVVEATLGIIDRVRARTRFTELLGDRHYSYKLPARWAQPLADRGIEQVLDLHKNDQGFRDYNGAKLAAGWLHCPGTPDELATINHPGPGASREAKNDFTATIERRQAYALRRVTTIHRRRFECPALAGTVGCPLRAGTTEVAVEGGLPLVLNPPARGTAPSCCTQRTVELKQDGQPKLWQKEYWGSVRWQRSYARRTFVEGAFGNIKNASGENLGRGFFRITGLARVTLFVGIAVTAHNMRQLRNWHERTNRGDPDHPLLAPDSDTYLMHLSPHDYIAFEAFLAARAVSAGSTVATPDTPEPQAA